MPSPLFVLEPFMILLYFSILGLLLGSFANVYFLRVPKNLSFVKPRSFCPSCKHTIAWYDNIPIFSYLILKGQCRHCHTGISIQYPLIELICAILFFSIAYKFRLESLPITIAFVFFAYIIFLVGGIDYYTYLHFDKEYGIIPDHLIWILSLSGLIFCVFNPIFENHWWLSPISGLAGALFLLFFRWAGQAILKKEAMGLGDVKLIGSVGLWLGWKEVTTVLIVGSILGSIIGIFFILKKKMNRHSSIPFGPFLAIGTFYAIFFL